MPSGLQTWDASLSITLDTNDSLSKIIGTVVTQQGIAGSVVVPDFVGGVRVFISRQGEPPRGPFPSVQPRSEISVSGRTITWTAGRGPSTFDYGVY